MPLKAKFIIFGNIETLTFNLTYSISRSYNYFAKTTFLHICVITFIKFLWIFF